MACWSLTILVVALLEIVEHIQLDKEFEKEKKKRKKPDISTVGTRARDLTIKIVAIGH